MVMGSAASYSVLRVKDNEVRFLHISHMYIMQV